MFLCCYEPINVLLKIFSNISMNKEALSDWTVPSTLSAYHPLSFMKC